MHRKAVNKTDNFSVMTITECSILCKRLLLNE